VAAAAVAATVGTEAVDAVAEPDKPDLHPIAIAVGEAWANETVRSLQSDDREIVGAWPGTLREARMRIRVAFSVKLDPQVVDELARVAYVAARRGWHELSVPDPES